MFHTFRRSNPPSRSYIYNKAAAPTAAAPTNRLQAPILIFPAEPVDEGEGAAAVSLPDVAEPEPLALVGPVYSVVRTVPFLHSPPGEADLVKVMSAH